MNNLPEPEEPTDDGMAQLHQLEQIGVCATAETASPLQEFLVFATLVYAGVLLIVHGVNRPEFFLALPAAMLVTDFLSGGVHWYFCTQVKPGNTPLGRIAVNFLDHQVHPHRTAEIGFIVSALRPALLVTLPLVTLATVLPLSAIPAAMVFWSGLLAMLVPQTHKEAHRPKPPRGIRWLQSCRLMLHPAAHQRHHLNPSQCFCVFTGWLNPLLDRSGFWQHMERFFQRWA